MKVVFFQDVEGTAEVGEVKIVKNGFARNFLLPRGLAGANNKDNLQRANSLAQKEARRQEKLDSEARSVSQKLEGYTVTIEARVGENGRLFGSVTNRDIAERLAAAGHEVDAHIILLAEPIRELGARAVAVKFTRNVTVEVTIDVVPDEESKPIVARLEAERLAQAELDAKRAAEAAYAVEQKAARDRRERGETGDTSDAEDGGTAESETE
ncbi:MAG: 50S ribosomal protein L9 [Dehalococcoidia bacterium]